MCIRDETVPRRMTSYHMLRAPLLPSCCHPAPQLRGPARTYPQAGQEEAREHKTHSSGWHLGAQQPGAVSVCVAAGTTEAEPCQSRPGELAARRFGSAGSIGPAPVRASVNLISEVWEVCPGGWHPLVGQARGE